MIYLYSGTPGSGKSLHVATVIYNLLRLNRPVICNFPINVQLVKNPTQFHYHDNSELTAEFLEEFGSSYWKKEKRPPKEGRITVVIDEAQMIFNSRSWDAKGRMEWLRFFQIHRHLGFDVILVAQFDRMLDRQIRCLIEYEEIHRKVTNMGWKGVLLSFLLLSPRLHACVKVWYPMKERVGGYFFRVRKRYYRLYDSYGNFS